MEPVGSHLDPLNNKLISSSKSHANITKISIPHVQLIQANAGLTSFTEHGYKHDMLV